MARLQDFAPITPTSSDSVLGVQSDGQGLIGIDTALSSSASKIPTSAAVKNAMNVYVDTSVSNRVHITLPTYIDDQVHGVSLKLYDSSANERTQLTTDGLLFKNASGVLTGNYPSDVNLNELLYFQTYTFNGVSVSSGTPGTRATQQSQSVYKSGYRPIVARLSYVSDSSLTNVVPFFGGGDESGLYVNFYRASGSSGTVDVTVIVVFVRTEVTGVSW